MSVIAIGIDLAKSIFQVCGVNQAGKPVFNRAVKLSKLLETILQYPDAAIAMEACSGSDYWGRLFQSHGLVVKLIPPQHVKPFVRGNKNDRNDAFAITEAARRPDMVFVPPRSIEATDMMVLHRIRERRQKSLTCLTNQLRGLLSEYGVVLPQGVGELKRAVPRLLEDADKGLSVLMHQELQGVYEEWCELERLITAQDKAITTRARQNSHASLLMTIKGIGPITSTALLATLGDPKRFRNGRHFTSSLGLTPSEHSSGGKQRLGRITKRGNRYLRWLLAAGCWLLAAGAVCDVTPEASESPNGFSIPLAGQSQSPPGCADCSPCSGQQTGPHQLGDALSTGSLQSSMTTLPAMRP